MDFSFPHFDFPFFTNLLILLVVAKLLGEVFERFNQPAMVGEIIAGILLGPSLLNIIHRSDEIKTISDLGVFMLVIIAGLEINFEDLVKSTKGKNIIISLTAFFIPIACGFALGEAFGKSNMTSLFIALCVAITALPVSIRILLDLGKLNSPVGQRIVSVAIFDDVLALSILGVILTIQGAGLDIWGITQQVGLSIFKIALLIVLLAMVYRLTKWYMKKENYLENRLDRLLEILKGKESLHAIFFMFILFFATITEALGFHFIIGAFIAALLLSANLIGEKHFKSFDKTVNGMAMGFLAPIFFASIGLELNVLGIQNYWLLIAILAVSYFSKIFGGYIGSRIAGYGKLDSLNIGFGLVARGIMGLVIADIAFKAGFINNEIFSILVVMAIVTTISTPILLKKGFQIENKKYLI